MDEGDGPITPESIVRDKGIPALFAQLAGDAREIARAEVDLVKARAFDSVDRFRVPVILFASAGVLCLAALIALLVGLIATLSPRVGPGPATLIVVGATIVIAATLGMIGKTRLSSRKASR